MLSTILSNLKISPDQKILILIDSGIAEYLKWNQESFINMKILSLEMTSMSRKIIAMYRPMKIVCFVSTISEIIVDTITEIQRLSQCQDIILLTTFSQEIFETFEYFHRLRTSPHYRIIYLPLHTIQILQSRNQNVGFFNLSSPSCRSVFPLLLHHLGEVDNSTETINLNNKRISKIHQIAAEDIPLTTRQNLKLLAHELAGSLIFDLGLDPSGSIFAVGKTSSLVGHTLQPLLATLSQQRLNQSHEGYNLLHSDDKPPRENLKNCSLILIDRTVDLFTPTSHDASPPLAHRVYCTQQTRTQNLDISVTQPMTSLLYPETCSSESVYNTPLSAVSALPIQINPSIVPPYLVDHEHHENNDFMKAMFTMSEETGKTILYDALKHTITESQGTLPPSKKRGIGAELLGLVNAIISPSSTPSSSSTLSHEMLSVESSGLLSWSVALIDSLQRSSTKQLQSHLMSLPNSQHLLQSISSYEMKSTREKVLLSSLQQQNQLSLLSYSVITEIILESCGLIGVTPNGVVDIEHMFLMTLGAFSLMESLMTSENSTSFHLQEVIAMIGKALTSYLVDSCPIVEISRLNLLREDIIKDISDYRQMGSPGTGLSRNNNEEDEDSETAKSTQQRLKLEVEDIILNFLDILHEISKLRISNLDPSSLPSSSSSSSSHSPPSEDICTLTLDPEEISQNLPPKHRIIKQTTSDLSRKPGSPEKISSSASASALQPPAGVLSKITSSILHERNNYLSGRSVTKISQLIHIENPIFSIARAGFGMLGRLGLSANVTKESHPSHHSILVIFVIGGISLLELKQIQDILNSDSGYHQTQVIVGSNSICSPTDLYQNIFIRH